MSDNYLHEAHLQHRITELEELLREASVLLHWAFFGNWKDDKASKELQERIDKVLGESDSE